MSALDAIRAAYTRTGHAPNFDKCGTFGYGGKMNVVTMTIGNVLPREARRRTLRSSQRRHPRRASGRPGGARRATSSRCRSRSPGGGDSDPDEGEPALGRRLTFLAARAGARARGDSRLQLRSRWSTFTGRGSVPISARQRVESVVAPCDFPISSSWLVPLRAHRDHRAVCLILSDATALWGSRRLYG